MNTVLPHRSATTHKSAAGFSLLEVLIATVILSVGLLGVAGLMSTTLKSNDSAYMRTQATVEAYNIIERMRANSNAVTAGNYVQVMPSAPSAATHPPDACTGTNCTDMNLASYDIGQWEYDLAQYLPESRGSIVTSATSTGTNVTVRVLWNDSRANRALNGAPAATTFSLSVHSVL